MLGYAGAVLVMIGPMVVTAYPILLAMRGSSLLAAFRQLLITYMLGAVIFSLLIGLVMIMFGLLAWIGFLIGKWTGTWTVTRLYPELGGFDLGRRLFEERELEPKLIRIYVWAAAAILLFDTLYFVSSDVAVDNPEKVLPLLENALLASIVGFLLFSFLVLLRLRGRMDRVRFDAFYFSLPAVQARVREILWVFIGCAILSIFVLPITFGTIMEAHEATIEWTRGPLGYESQWNAAQQQLHAINDSTDMPMPSPDSLQTTYLMGGWLTNEEALRAVQAPFQQALLRLVAAIAVLVVGFSAIGYVFTNLERWAAVRRLLSAASFSALLSLGVAAVLRFAYSSSGVASMAGFVFVFTLAFARAIKPGPGETSQVG